MNEISQEEVDKFNVDLKELCDKYSFTIASEALIHEGKIVSKVVVVPVKKKKVEEDEKTTE